MPPRGSSCYWFPQILRSARQPSLVRQNAPILIFSENEGCFPSDANAVYEYYIRPRYLLWFIFPRELDRSVKLYYLYSHDPDTHFTRILYWIWYMFNDFPTDPSIFGFEAGSHQGDWESIEVFLFCGKPFAYILSNHEGWLGLDPEDAYYLEGHLKVWVAEGSHAHYPSPTAEPYILDRHGQRVESVHDKIRDDTSASGQFTWDTRDQWLDMKQTAFWLDDYTGRWGHTNNMFNKSPDSPVLRQYENTGGDKKLVPRYKVAVQTSDLDEAGTNADVFINLFGTKGYSPEYLLDDMYDNFEQGRLDTFFIFSDRTYGELYEIRIGHNNNGHKPGWHLSHVIVKDLLLRKIWTFPCNRWLAVDKDDHQICRILSAE